jgi:peptide/nickel transport system permease protein
VTQYIVRRLLLMVPTVWAVTLVLFVLIRLTPGDPVQIEFGLDSTPDQIVALREELGLNRPVVVQYADWVGRILRGDFGRSLRARQPVGDLISERLPATLELALLAFVSGLVVALPLGVFAAVYRESIFAKLVTSFTLASLAIPNFFISTMLIYFFTYRWRVVETPRYVAFADDPLVNLRNIILPVFALGHITAVVYARFIRSSVVEVLSQDYIRTAHAKGLAERTVIARHALRNALIPTITLVGLALGVLWDGALITERIFNWPGVGRLAFTAIQNKDYPVVQAIVFISAISIMIGSLLADIGYAIADPRISYGHRR